MMLSKADLDELFPPRARPMRPALPAPKPAQATAPSHSRREDDGGRISRRRPCQMAPVPGSGRDSHRLPDPTAAAIAWATMPAAALFGTGWLVLASLGRAPEARNASDLAGAASPDTKDAGRQS